MIDAVPNRYSLREICQAIFKGRNPVGEARAGGFTAAAGPAAAIFSVVRTDPAVVAPAPPAGVAILTPRSRRPANTGCPPLSARLGRLAGR